MKAPSGKRPAAASLHDRLDALAGRWELLITSKHANAPVRGTATFEWIGDGAFLSYRWEVRDSPFPASMSIIGPDEQTGPCVMLYAHVRGVSRDLRDDAGAPDLATVEDESRFPATLRRGPFAGRNDLGRNMEAAEDGKAWRRDLSIAYRKRR